MSDEQPDGTPAGYDMIDVSTAEARLKHMCDRIREHAGRHDTIETALSCMARGMYTQLVADAISKALDIDTEESLQACMVMADLLVDSAPPNLRAIMMLGEAFTLYADAIDGKTVPLQVVQAYRSAAN